MQKFILPALRLESCAARKEGRSNLAKNRLVSKAKFDRFAVRRYTAQNDMLRLLASSGRNCQNATATKYFGTDALPLFLKKIGLCSYERRFRTKLGSEKIAAKGLNLTPNRACRKVKFSPLWESLPLRIAKRYALLVCFGADALCSCALWESGLRFRKQRSAFKR